MGTVLAAPRPLRFIATGGIAGSMQLGLLSVFTRWGQHPIPANVIAFFLSAQVNFLLSSLFTWHDRQPHFSRKRMLLERWAGFMGAIAGTALINQGVFIIARLALPTLLAAALGILVAAVLNFLAGDRLIFRSMA